MWEEVQRYNVWRYYYGGNLYFRFMNTKINRKCIDFFLLGKITCSVIVAVFIFEISVNLLRKVHRILLILNSKDLSLIYRQEYDKQIACCLKGYDFFRKRFQFLKLYCTFRHDYELKNPWFVVQKTWAMRSPNFF